MSNIRECKLCGKMVDFSEPWCDHETMEESAWRNIPQATLEAIETHTNNVLDKIIAKAAQELGAAAGKDLSEQVKRVFE